MGWVVNATPRPLYPHERPGTYCIEGWVGPRCGISCPSLGFDPRTSQPLASRYTGYALPARVGRVYRVSQEEWTKLRESVPYVELYRYNPKHLYPKLNGYGGNDHRKVWASGVFTYCTPSVTPYSSNAHARQRDTAR